MANLNVRMKLPVDFVRYLQSGLSRCGELPDFPLWFEIWPEEEMEQWNKEYQVQEYAPGFYGFAGDGGGEMYAFGPDGGICIAAGRHGAEGCEAISCIMD
jgi:hypothetical protein